jgi:hypothetical protein
MSELCNVSTVIPENTDDNNNLPMVVIESKFSGKIDHHMRYLDMCIFDCLARKEVPFASHKMFCSHSLAKNFWVPDNSSKWDVFTRDYCIHISDAIRLKAEKVVFYVDFGWSNGMIYAKKMCEKHGLKMEIRKIDRSIIKKLNPDTFNDKILDDFLDYESDNYKNHLIDNDLMNLK